MIYFASAAKHYAGKAPSVALLPTNLALPTDRRIAILGPKPQDKSVLLRLLSGAEKPSEGEVLTDVQMSPIIRYGVLFHRRLSILENIRFFARMLCIDADQLALTVEAICGTGLGEAKTAKGEDSETRKAAELAMLSLLPFQCYLIDEIWQLAETSRQWFFEAVERRAAGVIFTTNQIRLAQRYANCAVVIRDGTVYPFASIDEGIAFHEQR